MLYIQKEIEYKKTGVSPSVWALDIKSVNFNNIPVFNLTMKGFSSPEKYQEFLDNQHNSDPYFIDEIFVTVTSEEVGVTNTVGYPNIPALYEVLTTKVTEPASPFFGGEIIETN